MFGIRNGRKGFAPVGMIIGASLAAATIFISGLVIGSQGTVTDRLPAFAAAAFSSEQPEGVDFSPVWRAWDVIDQKFVDAYATTTTATSTDQASTTTAATTATTTEKESDDDRVWGMIQGLAASLGDPYTVFLPPADAKIFEDDISGSFEGVGMEIAIRDSVLTIVSPLKGTPAFRAGLKSADRITQIDGISTQGMSVDEAVKRIRGPRNSVVVLQILREGEADLLEISVTRDTIQIPTIDTYVHDSGIFVIELLNFSSRSPELFRKALREFVATGKDSLIVDLRGNPGGFLESAVDMASWFLPKGKIVVTEDYAGKEEPRIHRSRGYDIFEDNLKLVFLIDRGSASASEILAGTLKEYGKATLIGTRSFGKGTVQELIDITSDTSLKVTVARWLLAGDVFITEDGIEPDILLEDEEIDAAIEEDEGADPILDRAVEFLQKGE